MSLRLQIIIAVIIVVLMLYILHMIRKGRITLTYSLSWFALGFLLLILDAFPGIVYMLTRLLGIGLTSNMVFFLGILFLIILVFAQAVSISKLSESNKRLTQELAILKKDVESLRQSRAESGEAAER